jgi:transposase
VFGLGPATWIYLAAGVTDMSKGFEGLYGLVRDRLLCDPLSGHLFLFCNAQHNRLKVLVWDGSGLWVCCQAVRERAFHLAESGDAQGRVVLSHEELSLLLGGIDLAKTKHKRWSCVQIRAYNLHLGLLRSEPFGWIPQSLFGQW